MEMLTNWEGVDWKEAFLDALTMGTQWLEGCFIPRKIDDNSSNYVHADDRYFAVGGMGTGVKVFDSRNPDVAMFTNDGAAAYHLNRGYFCYQIGSTLKLMNLASGEEMEMKFEGGKANFVFIDPTDSHQVWVVLADRILEIDFTASAISPYEFSGNTSVAKQSDTFIVIGCVKGDHAIFNKKQRKFCELPDVTGPKDNALTCYCTDEYAIFANNSNTTALYKLDASTDEAPSLVWTANRAVFGPNCTFITEEGRIITSQMHSTVNVNEPGTPAEDFITLTGHTSWLMAVLGVGDIVVSGSNDHRVNVWAGSTGELISTVMVEDCGEIQHIVRVGDDLVVAAAGGIYYLTFDPQGIPDRTNPRASKD